MENSIQSTSASTTSNSFSGPVTSKAPISAPELQTWLVSYVADLINIEPEDVNVTIPFERYGISSEDAIILSGDLQELLGYDLDPTLLYDYPTVEALVQHLAEGESV
ncbi:MAG: acyl carrier protein [Cyanophyceae cyanobacterium]